MEYGTKYEWWMLGIALFYWLGCFIAEAMCKAANKKQDARWDTGVAPIFSWIIVIICLVQLDIHASQERMTNSVLEEINRRKEGILIIDVTPEPIKIDLVIVCEEVFKIATNRDIIPEIDTSQLLTIKAAIERYTSSLK